MGSKKTQPRTDLNGKRFGLLEVIGPSKEKSLSGGYLYECRCHGCGNTTLVLACTLERGEKKSCGNTYCRSLQRGKPNTGKMKFPGKEDCNCYASEYACSALTEMLCRTRGECKFYKSKEN